MMEMPTIVNLGWLYRFEDVRYAETEYDEYETRTKPWMVHVKLRKEQYPIYKRTPCGAWIHTYAGQSKFVNLKAKKKWACETWDDAIVSFIARKKRQVGIRECLLVEAQEALRQGIARKEAMDESRRRSEESGAAVPQDESVRAVREAEAKGDEVL